MFLLSTTHGAESVGLAAAKAVLQIYREQPIVATIWKQGERLAAGVRRITRDLGIEGHFDVLGRPCNLVYATLDRLEIKGFISSKLGERTPERGGKPKRFYQLTAPGLLALTQARDADIKMWADVSLAGRPA